MKNKTTNQHYIPQFILKNFISSSKNNKSTYYILNKTNNVIQHKNGSKFICSYKNLYEVNIIDEDNFLENYLSRNEFSWSNTILKIKNKRNLNKKNILNLYEFVTFQLTRTPEILNMFKDTINKINNNYNMNLSESTINDISKLMAIPVNINDDNIHIFFNNLYKCISQKQLYILQINPKINMNAYSFILGCNIPIVMENILFPNNKVITNIYFPISPYQCILLSNNNYIHNNLYINIGIKEINRINTLVFDKNDSLLGYKECLEKYKRKDK